MKRKIFLSGALLQLFVFLPVEKLCARESIENLLNGYFRNNINLLTLSNDVSNEILQKKADDIENGFDITLSTGTISFSAGDSAGISFSPAVSVALPQADNLKFSVSSDADFAAGNSSGEPSFTNTKLKVSADIYSGNMQLRKISMEKSERALLVSRRKLLNGFLDAETEFYEDLKNLYELASKIVTAKKTLYEDQLEFEQIKAQGYSTSSTKYRLSQMEVLTDERNVETYERKLERETRIFARKCGASYDGGDALDFLPEQIPEVEPVNVFDFDKADFAETEAAVWTNYINQKSRDADKLLSVSANGGYTFNKEIGSSYCDTIDAGTSLTWNGTGITANAGVSFPVDTLKPVYEFGLSIVPNKFRLAPITKQQKEIAAEQEKLAILDAESEYATTVISQKTELDDILWNLSSNRESYEMYSSLEADLAGYFQRGIITESEYKSAQVNKENYRIQCILNYIELIIYNNKTKELFVRDEELMVNNGIGE